MNPKNVYFLARALHYALLSLGYLVHYVSYPWHVEEPHIEIAAPSPRMLGQLPTVLYSIAHGQLSVLRISISMVRLHFE